MNMQATTPSNEKIREALELLRQAAGEKKEEVRGMVRDQYSDLRDVIGGWGSNITSKARAAVDNVSRATQVGQEKIKDAAVAVDESVHAKPWVYIGGIAVAGIIMGYLLGRKSS